MFGSDNQNKNLSDAANKKPDGNRKTLTGNKYAAKIASGAGKSASYNVENKSNIEAEGKTSPNIKRSDPIRGSFEGLNNQSSTMIQMNGTGYADPAIQKARYSKKDVTSIAQSMNGASNFTSFKKSGTISNYSSIAATNTSAFKLGGMLEVNKYFR